MDLFNNKKVKRLEDEIEYLEMIISDLEQQLAAKFPKKKIHFLDQIAPKKGRGRPKKAKSKK